MLTLENFSNLRKLPHEVVVDIVGNQYIYEYGEAKTVDIMKKVGGSTKMSQLFVQTHITGKLPSTTDLLYVINGLAFFLFAKSETICLSSVSFAGELFKEQVNLANEFKVDYLLEMIYKCEKMKFSKADTFYTRVYNKLLEEYNRGSFDSFY